MNTTQLEERFEKIGIVPVVVLDDAKDALPLAKALCNGGLPCAEITFRTAAAADSIRAITEEYPDMLVGAGTILTTKQVQDAVEAGASFIVCPGFDPEIVDYCLSRDIPVIPGCITPSEVSQAVKRGLSTVKFFPAEAAGGLPMIQAMAAPFSQIRFMPTGGINADNAGDYLASPKVLCCGGSWMVKKNLIQEKDFDKIEQLVREAAAIRKEVFPWA